MVKIVLERVMNTKGVPLLWEVPLLENLRYIGTRVRRLLLQVMTATLVSYMYIQFKRLTLYETASLNVSRRTCSKCGSPPGVKMADTLSFTAKVDMVDF